MNPLKDLWVGIFIVTSLGAQQVGADVLELKDGTVLNGKYDGGTKGTVRFLVKGQVKAVPVSDVIVLTFTGSSAASGNTAAPASPATATLSSAGNPSKAVSVGTKLLVRTTEDIGTNNKKEGERFTAKLEGNIVVDGVTLAPAGSMVYGRVLKSKKGGIGARKAILELTLSEIMVDGKLRPIKTSILTGEGESGGLGKKVVRGAAVGALANGNSGAETGAKVGAGIGILAGGKHAGLKKGSLIEFTLVKALNL